MGIFDFFKRNPFATANEYPKRTILNETSCCKTYPAGVGKLHEVVTEYADRSFTCYVFLSDEARRLLTQTVSEVNSILDSANELQSHFFTHIADLELAPPSRTAAGEIFWGFCRAEYEERTRTGKENPTPLKVYIETDSYEYPMGYSVIVHYSSDGKLSKARITQRGENYYSFSDRLNLEVFQIEAALVRSKFTIKKITHDNEAIGLSETLFNYAQKTTAAKSDLAIKQEEQFSADEKAAIPCLSSAGVNVDQFSSEKAIADAFMLLHRFVPEICLPTFNKEQMQIVHYRFSELTSTGKVPKNVAFWNVSTGPFDSNRFASCVIKYLADGTVNMANISTWIEKIEYKICVRPYNEGYRIARIDCWNLIAEKRSLLFKADSSNSDADAFDAIKKSICELVKKG